MFETAFFLIFFWICAILAVVVERAEESAF